MTNQQLYLAIGVPLLFNTLLVAVLIAFVNAKVGELGTRISSLERRFEDRFEEINQRFNDMRDLWRAELRRVEEILDARLKHLEARLP